MDTNKIDMFFVANGKKLPAEKAVLIREKMAQIDDSRYATISSVELKDPTTMLLVSIFLGELGVDRFMLGETGMGILKLLTAGLCGILWLIDLIGITKKVKEYNYNELMKIL
ncbi:TM2 domain-containing protein [Treponema succinifaciens]|uniref:TM2 domain containing protein n=1 Tax=Treponema succinifaciens (strain ATCC 33096 / DSM 2489 / 6091) TaxID=869209 RepID=F2NX64_TRES6|nr:TM2 domain-containing protein [Treponema succinifaciens]AEB13677.1 TM2 domain containing protein [Treponema succinifaciens DSM 2489]